MKQLTFQITLTIEGGDVDQDYLATQLQYAIDHQRMEVGMTREDDDGFVTDFQVKPLDQDRIALMERQRYELMGVLADVHLNGTFDDISRATLRRVIEALTPPK